MTVLSGLKKIFINTKKEVSKKNFTKPNARYKKTAYPNGRKKAYTAINRKIAKNAPADITFSKKEKISLQTFTQVPDISASGAANKKNKIKSVNKNNQKPEDDLTLKISSSDNKTVFLHFLSDCDTLKQAIKKSGISLSIVHYLLKTDSDFGAAVDEVLNKKLEFAAIDTALGGNSSLLTLMLTNRMPNKYKPKNAYEEAPPYSRIIYVDAEKEKNKGRKI